MAQVFPHWFDTIARAGILAAVFAVPATAVGLALFYRSDYVTRKNFAYEQPLPFSHAHHTGQLGIDCRYCHRTVEKSAFAGMPPVETCMNCHQQIWVGSAMLGPVRTSWKANEPIRWKRVHNLPGFVYFHHGVHVANGVACIECHGRVDRMPLTWQVKPLTMSWCLDCHRDPAPHLRPRSEVFSMTWAPDDTEHSATDEHLGPENLGKSLMSEYRIPDTHTLTSCSTCHR